MHMILYILSMQDTQVPCSHFYHVLEWVYS